MDLSALRDQFPTARVTPRRSRVIEACVGFGFAMLAALIIVRPYVMGEGADGPTGLWLTVLAVALAAIGAVVLWRALATDEPLRAYGLSAELFDASPEGRAITGPADVLLYTNPAWRHLTGHDPVRRFGSSRSIADSLFPGDADGRAAVTRLVESLRTGHEAREEIELATPGGHAMRLQLSAYPVPGHSGTVVWCTAEAGPTYDPLGMMQGQRGLLSAIFDAAPVGLMLLGPEERVLFVNETLAGWLGYTPADMLTGEMALGDLATLETGSQLPGEAGPVVLRGRDGIEVTFRVSTSQVKRADDSLFGTIVVAEPAAREGRQDETLFAVGDRFRHFFDHAPVGIVMLDHDGAVTATNAAFHALAGSGGQGLEGAPLTRLLRAEDVRDVDQLMAAARRNGAVPAPSEVHLAGEPERVAQLFLRAVGRDAGGGFIAYLVDLTEQKDLERQFVRSQKMQAVGQLAGGIAHDFNNLLTAMIGFCDLLLLRHQVGDQSFADIMQIKQNANRAANLVRQLLAFSRQQTLQPKVLGLTDVLAELSHLLQRLMGENIELRIIHGRDVGLVKVDQGQLEQVVINLVVNARDAMPDGGTLTIRTSNATREDEPEPGADLMPEGEFLLIEVGDTGRGIPDEHLDKIFEPFFTTKEAGAGVGLGLSTVYGIIKQTGGFIFAANGPGKGPRSGFICRVITRRKARRLRPPGPRSKRALRPISPAPARSSWSRTRTQCGSLPCARSATRAIPCSMPIRAMPRSRSSATRASTSICSSAMSACRIWTARRSRAARSPASPRSRCC